MSEPSTSLQARVARVTARLEEIRKAEQGAATKSEDFIDLKNANDPGGKRLKNVGGEGLNSLPKAGKAVGKDEGSGGDVKKGKGLGKGEWESCGACNGGKLVKKGELCKACGGSGKVKKCGEMSRPSMAKLEPQQTGGQKNTPPVVTAGIKVPGGGTSRAYQHDPPGAHSSDRVKKDEVPAAKPPSGAAPGKPAKPPTTGSPKVGGAPGGGMAGGIPKPPAVAKPAGMVKEEPAPSGGARPAPAKTGSLLPRTRVVNNAGVSMSGTVQNMYRQHQERQMRERFTALRSQHLREAGVTKSELLGGAAHHLHGLNAAISRRDDPAAQSHARLCVVYERLLGYDPGPTTPPEIETAAGALAKGEPPTVFRSFSRDKIVEDLFKAILMKLPSNTTLPADAKPRTLPGVKAPGGAPGSMKTSGAIFNLKGPAPLDFSQPNGVAPPAMPSVKMPPPGPNGASPMQPKPKGGTLAAIRQRVFGPGKTAASAPPSAGSPNAAPKVPGGK